MQRNIILQKISPQVHFSNEPGFYFDLLQIFIQQNFTFSSGFALYWRVCMELHAFFIYKKCFV